MERIQNYSGTQFTSKEFQEGLSVHGLHLSFTAPEYQETNGQVEVTWQTLQTTVQTYL